MRQLVRGPGVAICDACVRVAYEIVEQVEADEQGSAAGFTEGEAPTDEVMVAVGRAQAAALDGERDRARREFAELWERIGPEGDPLHRVTLAHYMADVQDDPHDELEWDRRALAAADSLTDERAKTYHASLAVRGFYASLHLNLGSDHEKLGQLDQAREQLARAELAQADLPPDGYGNLIRSGIAALHDRLATA